MRRIVFAAFIFSFSFYTIAEAEATRSCSVSITEADIVERIRALSMRAEAEQSRSLFTALQTRIRIAKAAGIDVPVLGSMKKEIREERKTVAEEERTERGVFSTGEYVPQRPFEFSGFEIMVSSNMGFVIHMGLNGSRLINLAKGSNPIRTKDSLWGVSPGGINVLSYRDDGHYQVVQTNGRKKLAPLDFTDSSESYHRAVDDNGRVIIHTNEKGWIIAGMNPGDVSFETVMHELKNRTYKNIPEFVFSSDNKYFIVRHTPDIQGSSFVELWDTTTGLLARTIESKSGISETAYSEADRTFAVLTDDNKISIYDLDSDRILGHLDPSYQVRTMTFGPKNRLLISDGKTRIDELDLSFGEPVNSFAIPEDITKIRYDFKTSILSALNDDNDNHVVYRWKRSEK
jgi:hypothetical protein